MSAKDRLYWDTVYREALGVLDTYPPPDPLLFMYSPPPRPNDPEPPSALDLACGLGQNGLWLASQGYTVDLVDISRVALIAAQAEAAARGLRSVNFLQVDFDDASAAKLRPFAYDLVCATRYFKRDLITQVRAAVKPGGRIIYETWNVNYLTIEPELARDQLVEIGELSGIFADWNLLRHTDNGVMSQVVAIKPGVGF
ncbi:MAG: class I SAM-dependent methyltransferase [bacterium]|nr:class I SAM-dependent methyltransferase [bacterium]